MEATDTVKTEGELCILVCQEYRHTHLEGKNCDGLDCGACQLLAQAEISFKAGRGEEQKSWTNELKQSWKLEGIREVVKWVKRHISDMTGTLGNPEGNKFVIISEKEWQAKLKDWE